jgi:hypothetical protein
MIDTLKLDQQHNRKKAKPAVEGESRVFEIKNAKGEVTGAQMLFWSEKLGWVSIPELEKRNKEMKEIIDNLQRTIDK